MFDVVQVASMTQDVSKWQEWFKYTEPEANELPGEWEEKCSELQRMILLRCFRLVRRFYSALLSGFAPAGSHYPLVDQSQLILFRSVFE